MGGVDLPPHGPVHHHRRQQRHHGRGQHRQPGPRVAHRHDPVREEHQQQVERHRDQLDPHQRRHRQVGERGQQVQVGHVVVGELVAQCGEPAVLVQVLVPGQQEEPVVHALVGEGHHPHGDRQHRDHQHQADPLHPAGRPRPRFPGPRSSGRRSAPGRRRSGWVGVGGCCGHGSWTSRCGGADVALRWSDRSSMCGQHRFHRWSVQLRRGRYARTGSGGPRRRRVLHVQRTGDDAARAVTRPARHASAAGWTRRCRTGSPNRNRTSPTCRTSCGNW